MSKNEIKGLQALALANGGSLSINPDTGLVEAGFLEQILPMVAGAGLMLIPGVGPLAAAAIVGGGYGLATGSVEKGLMAGLGAYGGAGLTTSLAGLGAEAGRTAAENLATEGFKTVSQEAVTAGSQEVAKEAAKTAALEGTTLPSNYADLYAQTGGAQQLTEGAAQKFINPQNFPGLTPAQIQASQASVPNLVASGSSPSQVIGSLGRASATQAAPAGVTAGNVATGLKEVGTSASAAGNFLGNNVTTIGSAALPLLMQDQTGAGPAGYQEDEYDRRLKGYKLSSNYQPYEPSQPNPYYQAQYAAGGPVERMSANALGGNTNMYPQSQQEHTNFATPTQMPASAEVTMNNQYRGVTMASGGVARYASRGRVNVAQDYLDNQEEIRPLPESVGVPRTGIYRDTDVDTARKDALTASMIRLGKIGKGAGIKPVALPKTSIKGLGDIRGATPEVEEAADGGVMRYNLGGYSDGGRMLKGPGDGMSDSIPASIAGKQPARLADGEFVVPADVVSHLGNGSTDAGAKKLYGMMDKIRKARTGKKKQAPEVNVDKYLPGKKKASGGIAGYAEGGVARFETGGLAGNIQNAYNQGYSGAQIGAGAILDDCIVSARAVVKPGAHLTRTFLATAAVVEEGATHIDRYISASENLSIIF
jgi:hypothetical protein